MEALTDMIFIAQSVLNGLMRMGLDTGVPVLEGPLTTHQYQETNHHNAIFRNLFREKGQEAAVAALSILEARKTLLEKPHDTVRT